MVRCTCEICGHELDPKATSTLRLLTGWVKGTANAIKYIDLNHYRYQHDFCRPRDSDDQLPLF